MRKKQIYRYFLSASLVLSIVISSCKKEDAVIDTTDKTDKELYDMAKVTSGFTWFKNSDILLERSSASGHSQPFLRTRYNTIAATMLNANGKIIEGSTFPEGSLIVKELYTNISTLDQYAILFKQSAHKNADAKGWVWGYIKADGEVLYLSSNKGASCTSCHSETGNIDYMLMNKYFP